MSDDGKVNFWRALASDEWESDSVQIEPDGKVSQVEPKDNGGVPGAWVQAWVWVEAVENENQGRLDL